jgi:hypothetical protein
MQEDIQLFTVVFFQVVVIINKLEGFLKAL